MAAVIKPGASDGSPTWLRRARGAFQQAKKAKLNEADAWKMVMQVVEDEIRKRDAMIENYRIFWCDHWTCEHCGEKTAREPLWEPEW